MRIKPNYLTFGQALEQLYYELKPLLFLSVAFIALRGDLSSNLFIKATCLFIVGFSAYIVYARLTHRGFI